MRTQSPSKGIINGGKEEEQESEKWTTGYSRDFLSRAHVYTHAHKRHKHFTGLGAFAQAIMGRRSMETGPGNLE